MLLTSLLYEAIRSQYLSNIGFWPPTVIASQFVCCCVSIHAIKLIINISWRVVHRLTIRHQWQHNHSIIGSGVDSSIYHSSVCEHELNEVVNNVIDHLFHLPFMKHSLRGCNFYYLGARFLARLYNIFLPGKFSCLAVDHRSECIFEICLHMCWLAQKGHSRTLTLALVCKFRISLF